MVIKIGKYLLNFFGTCSIIWLVYLSYALIVRFPDCENVMKLIWNIIAEIIQIMLVYLVVITGINYIVERKVEKKQFSKEFLLIFFINFLLIMLVVIYYSYDFFKHCGEIS